jgi:hypothetical protein
MLVHRCSVNQRLPVLETHHIPLEHNGRTMMLILVRVIYIAESVPEPLLFSLPSFHAQAEHTPAFSAVGTIQCEMRWIWSYIPWLSSLLDRTSADCVARLPRRPLI